MINLKRRTFAKQSGIAATAISCNAFDLLNKPMTVTKDFDVIIIGGSYSGLGAAMALGRALRKVLIIDSGKPCNLQTPHAHNFLTQDGKTPKEIAILGKQQVAKYDTIEFYNGLAISGKVTEKGFEILTSTHQKFSAIKLIFATGITDVIPNIPGFKDCWGISILHCPYCHGYEVKDKITGILGNGDFGFDFSKLIRNWTKNLTLFTNGKSSLTPEQTEILQKQHIMVVEKEIEAFEHSNGSLRNLFFKDGSKTLVSAIYTNVPFEQHCLIPEQLGCELTEEGYIKVDTLQKTSVLNIYACGDNSSRMRTLVNAVSMGTTAGMMLNKEFVLEHV